MRLEYWCLSPVRLVVDVDGLRRQGRNWHKSVEGRLEAVKFVEIHVVLGIVLSHNLVDVPLRNP